jgi:hypothetical protein
MSPRNTPGICAPDAHGPFGDILRRARRVTPRLSLVALTVAGCFCVAGCPRHRLYLYPVCFYEAAPSPKQLQDYYSPQLIAFVHTTLKDSTRVKATLSPDGRWLVANVTAAQNHQIAQVWPRIGCIGNAVDSQSTKKESDCVSYEHEFVTTGNYFTFGNAKDAGGFDIWNESPVQGTLVHCYQVSEGDRKQAFPPSQRRGN